MRIHKSYIRQCLVKEIVNDVCSGSLYYMHHRGRGNILNSTLVVFCCLHTCSAEYGD